MEPKKFDKKVLTVLMQWEYCDRRRGLAGEKPAFYDNIAALVSSIEGFWYDPYASNPPLLASKLLEAAEKFQPDLIFFNPYTNQLTPAFLAELKTRWPTCAWFGDDTWRFEGFSSKLAPHFTHVLTTDVFSVEKYRKLGIEPILTQWAAQPCGASLGPLEAGAQHRFEVSFVGAYNQVRGWFVGMLEKKGVKVECFGPGWPNGKVTFEEMERIFRDSGINLNLSNSVTRDLRFVFGGLMNFARYLRSSKTEEQIKARNFEIPLAGGFQLTNYAAGIERYLRVGEEVAVFATPEECAEQINYYLANETERRAVMLAGHLRAAKEHTYRSRFEKIFSTIWPDK
jgi:spore maturation protein CgeB